MMPAWMEPRCPDCGTRVLPEKLYCDACFIKRRAGMPIVTEPPERYRRLARARKPLFPPGVQR